MTSYEDLADAIAAYGFAIVPDCLSSREILRLQRAVSVATARECRSEAVRDRGAVYAIRNVLDVIPETQMLIDHPQVRRLVTAVLGPAAFCVRGTLFDKSPRANWGVFWHQDLSIAVRRREAVDGYGPWTRKAGVTCVQPPVQVLESMLAVRIHLDAGGLENGALRVLPGSHRHARLSDAQTRKLQTQHAPVVCTVPAGGAVLMRPLLLHSSSKMTVQGRRRVIHLEFASVDLPAPLQWFSSPGRVRCA